MVVWVSKDVFFINTFGFTVYLNSTVVAINLLSFCSGGIWGRVCHLPFHGYLLADAFCRNLGYPSAMAIVSGSFFGQVDRTIPTWADDYYYYCFSYPSITSQVGV